MNDDKKAQYLKREEVRTMEKDIARLRERESEIAREKIAQIKTEEEAKLEVQRLEQSKIAAQERAASAEATAAKEKELEGLRAERAASAASEAVAATKREEEERESLRAQLKEAQSKEEEERRKFIESVSRQAGEEVPPEPAPPIPPPIPPVPPIPPPMPPIPPPLPADVSAEAPEAKAEVPPSGTKEGKKPFKFSLPKVQLPKVPLPKITGYFPGKPSLFEKIWIRIIVSLFILAILATIATFWYWYLVVRPPQTMAPPAPAAPPAAAEESVPEKIEIVQKFLRSGYYLPPSVRVIDAIIIHSGSNASNDDPYDLDDIIQSYKTAGVATHYLISRDGAIYQLAPDYAVAYHAGNGKMPDGRSSVNNLSIGISLVYQESESPNNAQYQSLSWLTKELLEKYNIPAENILGYKDIIPGKITPWNFDWEKFKLLISLAPASPLLVQEGAEFILTKLTLEKKIGQLLMVGFEGAVLTPELENFIKMVSPGGVILFKKNIEGPFQIKKLLQDLQKISLAQTGLPLFIAIDQEGGVVSRMNFAEEKTSQSEIKTSDRAYNVGLKRGAELKELGINLNLSPLLDLTQPGDFLHERSFQKGIEDTGNLAKALISGQKAAGILTAIKHFPGYGGISFNPEERLATAADAPQISHFQKAMEANPEFVMTANVIYPIIGANSPLAFSAEGIVFLKEKLGENVLVITDDLPQKSLLDVFLFKEAVTLPIKAGVDVLLFSDWKSGADAALILEEAVKTDDIPEKIIDKAVLKIIQLKQNYFSF